MAQSGRQDEDRLRDCWPSPHVVIAVQCVQTTKRCAMLKAGQLFRLTCDIVAIEPLEDRMRPILIPPGNTICVVKYPCAGDDRMAHVLWDGKPVVLVGRDLHYRAKEIKAIAARVSGGG